jgi:Mg-chelatase subunit ChlD
MKTACTRLVSPVFACLYLAASLGVVIPCAGLAQCTFPTDLTSGPLQVSSDGVDYSIFYTDSTNSPNYFPAERVGWLQDMLPDIYDRHVTTYNFRPHFSTQLPNFNIGVYDYGSAWASAYASCFVIESDTFDDKTEPQLRKTTSHEMFHTIQRSYMCDVLATCDQDNVYIGSNFGKWVSEGQARFMDDRHFADLDTVTFSTSFHLAAGDTLSVPSESYFDKSYDGALFWSYCAEQFGLVVTEPQRGVDLVRAWWERITENGSSGEVASIQALRDILALEGRTLEDVFHDYAICNMTREYDVAALPNSDRYNYIDEGPAGGNLAYPNNVPRTILGGFPSSVTSASIDTYAADYFQISVGNAQECLAVGMLADSDVEMGYALVGIDASGNGIVLSKQSGTEYGRTILVSPSKPITTLEAVVIGLDQAGTYNATFGAGPIEGTVVRPTVDHQAYPGPAADPGRFLVRAKVMGPPELTPDGDGTFSVKGLQAEDFSVRVGTNDASVLSAGYAGSEYWLSVQAPAQAVDDVAYDLTLELCGESSFASLAVMYGDIQLNHVVTLDHSGSMDSPSDYTKLQAAKDAAKLYIDSVSDGDGLGLVQFSGNNAECDDDAATVGTNEVSVANDAIRSLFKAAVDMISPDNMTSIGDGLVKAADLLNAPATPPSAITNNYVLLLSDGMENEELYWGQANTVCALPALRDTYPATDAKVNAIAFGPGSDQPLMQEIGALTGGDQTYVDVTDSAAARSGSGGSGGSAGSGMMPNSLKSAFLQMLEEASGLERVYDDSVAVTGGARSVLTIPVYDTDISEALFYVAWNDPAVNPAVQLYDSSMNVMDASADVNSDQTHKVYHFTGGLPNAGNYTISVDPRESGEVICGLLCRSYKGLKMDLIFSQIKQGSVNRSGDTRTGYEAGLPVTIVALVTDRSGPVRNARIRLSVTRPDGTVACGPLNLLDDGTSGDGEPDDAVYGAVYTDTSQAARPLARTDDLDSKQSNPRSQRGTYLVKVTADGTASSGEPFTRIEHGAFTVYQPHESDFDQDGMPDPWERHYGTDVHHADDGNDPDGDGLKNIQEFGNGTHPFNADTDHGGEADGSEVAAGRCPINAADDLLPTPLDVEVYDDVGCEGVDVLLPNANLIRFPLYGSYEAMNIYVSLNPTGPFETLLKRINLTTTPTANYHHQGLTSGLTYYYQVQAEGAKGALSGRSRVFSGTPYVDPVPPNGRININNGFAKSDSPTVLITLEETAGASEYRISKKPILGTEPLNAVSNRLMYTLNSSTSDSGYAYVYVQFVKPSGLAGRPFSACILVDQAGDHDGDIRINSLDQDDDGDGLSDHSEILTYATDAFNADTDGDGLSDYAEVITRRSNPRSVDSDNDGLLDGDEGAEGTDINHWDTDGDGMPDGFEVQHALGPTSNDAGLDEDGDGLTNYEEWLTGTNPADAASLFRVVDFRVQGASHTITFPSLRGRTYQIYYTHDPVNEPFQAGPSVMAEGYGTTITLPAGSTRLESPLHYRVHLTSSP